MMIAKFRFLGIALVSSLSMSSSGCRRSTELPAGTHTVAVTNSYLQCALMEFAPTLRVYQMAGPGQCPGHFDLQPSQIEIIHRCRLLLRFDFQAGLDEKLGASADGSPRIVAVTIGGGLCVPESYLDACRQISEALVTADILEPADAQARLSSLGQRLAELSDDVKKTMTERGISGRPVLCSRHQEAFCRWLGLSIAGTFTSSDATTPVEITRAIESAQAKEVKTIIANEPEGRRLADRLANRLNAEVVVFANFPTMADQETPFDDLLRENVRRLLFVGNRP